MGDDLVEFYESIPIGKRESFEYIANVAIRLGYRVRRDKVKHIAFSFLSSKYKNGIMRFVNDKGRFKLKLKYYGVNAIEGILEDALKEAIEEYGFKYTGCYRCGKCKGDVEGYRIAYENGDIYFRCGSEYIDINKFNENAIGVIEAAMIEQTSYYALRNAH